MPGIDLVILREVGVHIVQSGMGGPGTVGKLYDREL